MLKAAIVGTGGAAWVGHLPWLWEHADVKLIAPCALDRKDAQAAADRWAAVAGQNLIHHSVML